MKKFNSQICTTREQSERLLALGLRKETADMAYLWYGRAEDDTPLLMDKPSIVNQGIMTAYDLPAWSLHRLIEMMPDNIAGDWLGVAFDEVTYYHGAGEEMIGWKFYKAGNVYNCCIDCIEWLIKEGYFPKEYLV